MSTMHVLPPDTSNGQCPECGHLHPATEPHNAPRLVYQYQFYAKHGRFPTWADAMAHCSPETQAAWKKHLLALGAWDGE